MVKPKHQCALCGDFVERVFFSRELRKLFREQCAKRGVRELDIAIASGFNKEWYEKWMLGDPRHINWYGTRRTHDVLSGMKEMMRMVGVELKLNFVISESNRNTAEEPS